MTTQDKTTKKTTKKVTPKRPPYKKPATKKAPKKAPSKKAANDTMASDYKSLLKLLKRSKGCSVEDAADSLDYEEAIVRGMIDGLRRRGEKIKSQGKGIFKAV